jgi:hypothetical protein
VSGTDDAYEVRLVGEGVVEIVAYGLADAEHQAEKEFAQRWPGAAFEVADVARAEPGAARIAEEFRVGYRVRARERVSAVSADAAGRAALRGAQARLAGSRFARTAWQRPAVGAAPAA